jgi:ParB-like chromosome segregation protein Spo0J
MQALKVMYQRPSEISVYENNSRTHSDDQIRQIRDSITEFGFTNPLLVDEQSRLIAGHGRLQAAMELDLEMVPTIVLEGLSDTQKAAYVIADNKLALNAAWNMEILMQEIQNLQEDGFDVDLLGFDPSELQAEELDYGLLEDIDTEQELRNMNENVMRGIQIEFEQQHYEEAQELIKYWREAGGYVGMMLINHLRDQKEKQWN